MILIESANKIIKETKYRLKGKFAILACSCIIMLTFLILCVLLFSCSAFLMDSQGNDILRNVFSPLFAVIAIFVSIVSLPVFAGFKRLIVRCSEGKKITAFDLFYFYSNTSLFTNSVLLYLELLVRILIPFSIALIIVYSVNLVTRLVTTASLENPNFAYTFSILSYVFDFLVILIAFIYISKHLFVTHIAVKSNCKCRKESFKASKLLVKKYRTQVLMLFFRVSYLLLASILLFPLIYSIPVISTAFSTSCKWLIQSSYIYED